MTIQLSAMTSQAPTDPPQTAAMMMMHSCLTHHPCACVGSDVRQRPTQDQAGIYHHAFTSIPSDVTLITIAQILGAGAGNLLERCSTRKVEIRNSKSCHKSRTQDHASPRVWPNAANVPIFILLYPSSIDPLPAFKFQLWATLRRRVPAAGNTPDRPAGSSPVASGC